MEFRRILVPVSGMDTDQEAIRLACTLAKKEKGKIWAVYIITVRRDLPLDAEIDEEIKNAEKIFNRAQAAADEQDYEIETDVLQAREAGPSIVDEAVDRKVDLIVMGVQYKGRFGQFSMGSVVLYVLKNASCRVILYYPTPGELA